ncbi:hypothetical protein [Staphylococcus epidermidis]|nr:hypothetical protein [Staphylococcus epidermidis]
MNSINEMSGVNEGEKEELNEEIQETEIGCEVDEVINKGEGLND